MELGLSVVKKTKKEKHKASKGYFSYLFHKELNKIHMKI